MHTVMDSYMSANMPTHSYKRNKPKKFKQFRVGGVYSTERNRAEQNAIMD